MQRFYRIMILMLMAGLLYLKAGNNGPGRRTETLRGKAGSRLRRRVALVWLDLRAGQRETKTNCRMI
jgi:hypothetical protein